MRCSTAGTAGGSRRCRAGERRWAPPGGAAGGTCEWCPAVHATHRTREWSL